MPTNQEHQIRRLENKIREIERRERDIDSRLAEFNSLMREQQRMDEDSHQSVVQELAHLDRQMSMLSTRAEEQIAKLDLDRDDFGLLTTDVGGINTNVSSILSNVGKVDTNVGSALTSIGNINDDVGTVLSNQSSLTTAVSTAKGRADDAWSKANTVEQTVGSINTSINSLGGRLGSVESTTTAHNHRLIALEQFTESFISSTLIETLRGKTKIKQIEPGVRVLRPTGYGPITRLSPETVLETPHRAIAQEPLTKIVLPNHISFIATTNHKIAVLVDGDLRLLKVSELREGHQLFSYQRLGRLGFRKFKPVIEIHEVTGFREVYNLRLPHRQFLIDGGVLAH